MNQGFSSYNPVTCLAYYIGVISLVMTFYHPLFLITALILLVIVNIITCGREEIKKNIGFYVIMGLAIAVMNPLLSHRGATILFYLFDNPITLESILYGFVSAMSLTAVLMVFSSLNKVLYADKLLYLFSWILPNTTLVIMLSMRFVPLFRNRLHEIIDIQKTRSVQNMGNYIIVSCKNGMQVFNILLARSLEDAVSTAQSMRARGYHLNRKRTFYFKYTMDKRDWILTIVMILMLVFLIFMWNSGWVSFEIYPTAEKLIINDKMIVGYLLFCLFIAVPIMIEGGQRFRWHS